MKTLYFVLVLSLCRLVAGAQVIPLADTTHYVGYLVPAVWIEGEWVPHINLRQITILPPIHFKNAKEQKKYSRLEYNIKKVYPLAQKIQVIFFDINSALDTIKGKREKKAYIDRREAELKVQFEQKLRKLTFSQGRLLIKLVDRQTGETTYEVVKTLKGSLSAFFWQGVARIFGSNLKSEYDVNGDDWMVEDIITRIENGQL